jgi:hypothetical protein
MKGTLSEIAKKSLEDKTARKEVMKVIAGDKEGIVTIGTETYRIVSTNSNHRKKEVAMK